jgi:hypothetical protein
VNQESRYLDLRSEFWRKQFEKAPDYETYLAQSPLDKAERWRTMAGQIPPLSDGQRERLAGFGRRMMVLVLSGVWCGDCVRQGPMLLRAAEACGPSVDLRFCDREAFPELRDELRICGGARVPAVVFLSEDFYELGRFGDRLLTAYRAKFRRELGPACDAGIVAPPVGDLAAEQAEWVDCFERMLLMLRLSPPLRARYGD